MGCPFESMIASRLATDTPAFLVFIEIERLSSFQSHFSTSKLFDFPPSTEIFFNCQSPVAFGSV